MAQTPFAQGFFDYFNDLAHNNEREWFQEHKPRYEREVVEPALALISAMQEQLAAISPHFEAIPKKMGGSMFRIYRDTRFSKDKTPYKTHMAIQFRHKLGKDVHCPGFYMHASPREVTLGVGIWRPAGADLQKIRTAIEERPREWQAARDDHGFRTHFELYGESLKRPPKGFAKDHPQIEDLKRKDHIARAELAPPELLRADFETVLGARYAAAAPYVRFLCEALEVPF